MPRWTDYYKESKFTSFWENRSANNQTKVLLVFGVGFDPRSLITLKSMYNLNKGNQLDCIALQLKARPALGALGETTETLTEGNVKALEEYEACLVNNIEIEMHDEEGHNVAGRRVVYSIYNILVQGNNLSRYTDIIVDISGMPRGIFFPLIKYLLKLYEQSKFLNLHISVVEDPDLDSKISGREYGRADYLHSFGPQGGESKIIWLPLICKKETSRLEKIHNMISGACIEICPIVPFPSRSLRRADDVLIDNAELLFESFLVSYNNLLLCDEQNPFDIYRKIVEVEEYYRNSFGNYSPIGNVTTVVSPLGGKTLSLGMLLAAIERELPICHVEPGTYQIEMDDILSPEKYTDVEPIEIWLEGDIYRS